MFVKYFVFLFAGFIWLVQPQQVCNGFLPENDLKIPVSEVSIFTLNQNQFNSVLDRVEKVYQPIIASLGGKLEVKRLWTDDTVNASAMRFGNRYILNMYGGMARYPSITEEAFALVACHELGHHIAGAPKVGGWFNTWASNEGQSDYFAGLKCFRKIYSDQENVEWANNAEIHPIVLEKCTTQWASDADAAVCARFAMAGRAITQLFKEIKFPNDELGFESPDNSQVRETDDRHPRPQCRLDTYLASALCDRPIDEKTNDQDPEVGACTRLAGYTVGVRPLCWYKP
ncbi:MAG: hypothetical protein KDD58_11905 [Bdellovibrionales bacterium]|nr:hypothetical protein [Bdellovibrionales bacterium]